MNVKAALINVTDLRLSVKLIVLFILIIILKAGVCSISHNGAAYTRSGEVCIKFKYAGRWYHHGQCAGHAKSWCATSTRGYKYDKWDHCTRNPCKYHKCSSNRKCYNIGTQANCRPICPSDICGVNTNCVAQNHKAVCFCKPGYIGNPYLGCRAECVGSEYISSNMSSLHPFNRNTSASISLLPGIGKHFVSFEVGEMTVFQFLTSLKLQVILRQEELTEKWILEGKVIDDMNRPMFNHFEHITLPIPPPYGEWLSLRFLITNKEVTISLTWDKCTNIQSFSLTMPGNFKKKSLYIRSGNVRISKPFQVAWDCRERDSRQYNPVTTVDDNSPNNYKPNLDKNCKK
ncbi:unnamed protein product, partial [Meganyctiphanes norvegica]